MQKLISPADAPPTVGIPAAQPMRPAMVTIAALGAEAALPFHDRVRRLAGKSALRSTAQSSGDSL